MKILTILIVWLQTAYIVLQLQKTYEWTLFQTITKWFFDE